MESNFEGAKIDGADFTNAVLSRIQQKELCEIANGTNSSTGESTEYSLGCCYTMTNFIASDHMV